MNISDLKASVTMLLSSNNDFIEIDNENKIIKPVKYKGTLLVNLFYDISILQLENDLRTSLEVENDFDFSDVLANHSSKLEMALSFLQLFNLYFEYNDGEGNKNNERMKYYSNLYNYYKSNFYKYKNTNSTKFENVKVYK